MRPTDQEPIRKRIRVTFDGLRWQVKDDDEKAPLSEHRSKLDAFAAAEERAKANTPSAVIVHYKDGKVEAEWSYSAESGLP